MSSDQKSYYLSKLRKAIIFRYLKDDTLLKILDIAHIVKYKPNDKIISEGEVSPYMFAILEGSVNVSVREAGGKEVFICATGEGEVFGEAGIFLKAKRTANIVSTDNTTMLRIQRQDLLEFIKNQPSSGIKILMIMIYGLLKKLRDANQEIAFERKTNLDQDDIDAIAENLIMRD